MKRAAIRVAAIGLESFFMLTVALFFYLHMQWSHAMPHAPDPASGRVYRLVVNHGWTIFVTIGEARFFTVATDYVFPLAIGGFFIGVALHRRSLQPRR
jgi:hypothetical protein